MGNSTSTGQGSEMPHGKRDVKSISTDSSNWPELAGAKLAESSGEGRKTYIGTRTWGSKSSIDGADESGPNSSRASKSTPNSTEEQQSPSKVGVASSDEEDDGVRGVLRKEDCTLRRRNMTLSRTQSKSSLQDADTRELAELLRGPLPSPGTRELAGSPRGSLPSASVQELVEQDVEVPLAELRRLAAELHSRLELQKKEDRGCGPTGALWGPPAVRPATRSRPTGEFYEPQVVRPTLEKVQGSGPTDNGVLTVRNERETPSVVRPTKEHSQLNSANGNTDGVQSNGKATTSDVCGMQSPARSEGQIILSPALGQLSSVEFSGRTKTS